MSYHERSAGMSARPQQKHYSTDTSAPADITWVVAPEDTPHKSWVVAPQSEEQPAPHIAVPETLSEASSSESQPQRRESIFTYYRPESEVEMVRNVFAESREPFGETTKQMKFYFSENVVHFLNEYVGQVPYSKISFLNRNNTMQYAGVDLFETMSDTARQTQIGSRERAQEVGTKKMYHAISQKNGMAVSLSPAYIGDYGFAFVMAEEEDQTVGKKINEYILRYPEKKDTVTQSKQYYEQMTTERCNFRSAQEFLERPLTFTSHNVQADIDYLMQMLGVDAEKIAYSRLFESTIRTELWAWIDTYTSTLIQVSLMKPGSERHTEGIHTLRFMLQGIFNRAQEIQQTLYDEKQQRLSDRAAGTKDLTPQEMMAFYANSKVAEIIGGGSCPVVGEYGVWGYGMVSDIYSAATSGQLPGVFSPQWSMNHQRCSVCGGPADGHYHCPGDLPLLRRKCLKSFASELHKPSHKWTPSCSECGFEFRCAQKS